MKRRSINVALVHWPVLDKAGTTVATNVTNFDIHDIARASRTYGVTKYFIVNRLREQLMFVSRVLAHWRIGDGSEYNPKRKLALGGIEVCETVQDAVATFAQKPYVVATSARSTDLIPTVTFRELRQTLLDEPEGPPVLILFGTGFGLHDDVLRLCDVIIEPIRGAPPDDFRHLSVRSAVSICLDRLLGAW
jgi:hypothetical protein